MTAVNHRETTILLLFIFLLVLNSGCLLNFLPLGSVNVQSDPSNAEVYLDSVYKGTTPCLIEGVSLGDHIIELRHDEFPVWRQNITLEFGKKENITADLSENLIPNVSLLCKSQQTTNESSKDIRNYNGWTSSCIYAINEPIHVSGVAVGPHLKENPNVKLSLKRTDTYSPNSNSDYSVPIHDDFTFDYTIPNLNLPSGKYQIVALMSSGQTSRLNISIETASDTRIRILKQIVEDYHQTHTYSLPDLFVCADMAIDVWDMVETKGINAIIEMGNVEKDITTIQDSDHAWVLAEISSNNWIALETTGGFLVCNNPNTCPVNNPRYYHGWSYNTPKEFKDALDKLNHPCPEGYILGSDNLCHQSCGGNTYCTGTSVCINGQCVGCKPGYILGNDLQCHQLCGSNTYCTGMSVCLNGQCVGCNPGYYLGTDLQCHKS
jgi:hypothetical protein